MNGLARVVRLGGIVAFFMLNMSACTSANFVTVADRGMQGLALKSKYTVARSAQWRLAPDTPITLAIPQDTQRMQRKRSAFSLNQSLQYELSQAFPDMDHLGDVRVLNAALKLSLRQGKQVLIWPQLGEVHDNLNSTAELFEGRALHPEKSRKPDRIAFQVLMYDVRSGKLLDNAHIVAHGRMFAPDDSGPLDLYAQAARAYVKAIAGHSPRIAQQ